MNLDLSPAGLRRASTRAAELFTEIYTELEQRRVDPGVTREEMRKLFLDSIGEDGVGLDQALTRFRGEDLAAFHGDASPNVFRAGQFVAAAGRTPGGSAAVVAE